MNRIAAKARILQLAAKTLPLLRKRMEFNRNRFARSTTILCTIGPACRRIATLLEMLEAGMDVARLHCSYADPPEQAENIRRLRRASAATRKPVSIMQDLSGAKVRMEDFAGGQAQLKRGEVFSLVARSVKGNRVRVSVNIPEILDVIEPDDPLWLADGELALKVIRCLPGEVRCRVVEGGLVKSRQAVHVPGKAAPITVPTPKDFNDVAFGIRHGVDWIAQSYATSGDEIHALRRFIQQRGARLPIIAKIERREAVDNLEELIRAADGIMVARGDLGLAYPLEEIPFVQKHVICQCRAAGKFVITATELLASMVHAKHPTRAEVCDVANAILDGSDALLLSGETSKGDRPVEALSALVRISRLADQRNSRGDHRRQFSLKTLRKAPTHP